MVEKTPSLTISSDGILTLRLESPTGAFHTVSTSSRTISGWSYISVSVLYHLADTSIKVYVNNAAGSTATFEDYLFRDAVSQNLILGKSSSSSFTGFLYTFKLWNSQITTFSSEYSDTICGTNSQASCL